MDVYYIIGHLCFVKIHDDVSADELFYLSQCDLPRLKVETAYKTVDQISEKTDQISDPVTNPPRLELDLDK